MTDYLRDYTVMDTRDAEQTRSILIDTYDAKKFDLLEDEGSFSAKAGYFHFGNSSLSYCSYGTSSKVEFRDDDYVRFQFAAEGLGSAVTSQSTVEVAPDVIVCTPAAAILTFGRSFRQLALRIDRNALQQDLTSLLGVRPKESISFETTTDARTGHAARFRAKMFYRVASIDLTQDSIPAPLLREMDQTIRLKALFAIHNNFSDRLKTHEKDASAWQVRQVEEWIDANWREQVTIDTLVRVSGASARSIFSTFKRARGYGPMAYLKMVRLEAARNMLTTATRETSVTGIALACGFFNTSHFTKLYSARYGELPSETRRHSLKSV